jgi:hypothetical protein
MYLVGAIILEIGATGRLAKQHGVIIVVEVGAQALLALYPGAFL